ncbi:MAG: FtsX-like permease family protein [Candidatus Dormibacteria bacterium]
MTLAALAYVALLGTSSGTTAVLTGDIGKAWNTPYDLLVRPTGDVTKLERTQGLVSPNFISSINGGITEAQWHAIEHVNGVSVAAPLAIVGYVPLLARYSVPGLIQIIGKAPLIVLRLSSSEVADGGLARYTASNEYVVIAPGGSITYDGIVTTLTYDGRSFTGCNQGNVICNAGRATCVPVNSCIGGTGAGKYSASLEFPIPVLLAGISPTAEARLTGLKSALVSGHFLPSSNAPLSPVGQTGVQVPVLVGDQSYIGEAARISVSEAANPVSILSASNLAASGPWKGVSELSTSVQALYAQAIRASAGLQTDLPDVAVPGALNLRTVGGTHVRAETVPSRPRALANPNCINCAMADVPPEAYGNWYRQLTVSSRNGANYLWGFNLIGTFAPSRLAGFNRLAGGNLSAFAPPQAVLPDGKPLLPTRNPAGLITSPPLILTNLAGAQFFADNYSQGQGPAFISAIQVKVSDTSTPSNAAQARLETVAAAIKEKTGLQVSLVKGSAALPVAISLPKGKFGEPPMTVTEYWGKEGAAITFLRGLSLESLVLFLLTLGVVLALLGVVGQLGVRRRSQEFAMLRAIGWPLSRVFRLVLTEMALLGTAIGVITAGVAVGASRILDPAIQVGPLLVVVPLVLVMSVAAPLPALLGSSRSSASAALRSGGTVGRIRVRSVRSLALRELLGPWRVESLFCAGSSAIGSGLVGGVVLVVGGFAGQLGPTTLGHYLGAQVGPLDVMLVAIAAVAGASASATLLTLAYLERQVEFSTLRAVGWPRGSVTAVIAIQALVLGLGGGLAAAGVVAVGGVAIGAPVAVTVAAPTLSVLVALVTTGAAMTGTLSLAYRLGPAEALRAP